MRMVIVAKGFSIQIDFCIDAIEMTLGLCSCSCMLLIGTRLDLIERTTASATAPTTTMMASNDETAKADESVNGNDLTDFRMECDFKL